MKWNYSAIGEHCEVTSSKRIFFSEYVETGVPFYRSKEIIEKSQGQPISEPLFISREKYQEILHKFGVPVAGDVLLTSVGTIGIPYVVKPEDHFYFKDGNLTWFRNFDKKLLPDYLFYWINSAEGQGLLNNATIGSSQKALTISTLKQIKMPLPPIELQTKIVSFLSAYDELIENNQKQIKLLEEAAQRLYKEWFVDLRFPGRETTPIVNGVPEGWKVKSVAECLSFHGNGGWGKEAPTGKYAHAGRVIRGTDIPDIRAGQFGEVPLRYHTDVDVQKRVLMKNDLVFELSNGNIDNIGRCLLIDDMILKTCGSNTICASFCKLLRPIDQLHAIMLYFEVQDMQSSGRMLPLKKHGSNGINNFDFDGFLNHRFVIPANAQYISTLTSIVSKISVLQKQMSCLREARDRLLPKLMSGEVEV